MIQYRASTKTHYRTQYRNKTKHTCHQKMQGWGRLRAILRTEGDGEGLYLYHRTTGRMSSSENYHLNPSWAV